MKKAALYALKKLNCTKIQRYKKYKRLNSEKKTAFYALKKLAFAENQRYTVCKR